MDFIISININGTQVNITDFIDGQQSLLTSTFNEKLSLGQNDQNSLTFSVAKYIVDPPIKSGYRDVKSQLENPFLKYLVFGRIIYLTTPKRQYEFVIKDIAPQLSTKNVVYNYTCQDLFSFKLQKYSVGYSYSTTERGELQTIYEIVDTVLIECGLSERWVTNQRNNKLLLNNKLRSTKITLDVENSNPYNVIIEAINALNAAMIVDYGTHNIHFYQKDSVLFSGFRYRPEINLRTLTANYSIEEMTTIMHVVGGTDEYDRQVLLVPVMPDAIKQWLDTHEDYQGSYTNILTEDDFQYTTDSSEDGYDGYYNEVNEVNNFCMIADRVPALGQFIYDFSFFKQNGLMSQIDETVLDEIFNQTMPNINKQLRPLVQNYYMLEWEVNKALVDANTQAEIIMADLNAVFKINTESGDTADRSGLLTDARNTLRRLQASINQGVIGNYKKLYSSQVTTVDNTYVPIIQDIIDKISYYKKMRDEAYIWYKKKQQEYYDKTGAIYNITSIAGQSSDSSSIDADLIELESDICYYYDRFTQAIQFIGADKTNTSIFSKNSRWHNTTNYLALSISSDIVRYTNNLPSVSSNFTPIPSTTSSGFFPTYYSLLYNEFISKIVGNTISVPNQLITLERDINLPNIVYNPDNQILEYVITNQTILQEFLENPQELILNNIIQINSISGLSAISYKIDPIIITNTNNVFEVNSFTHNYNSGVGLKFTLNYSLTGSSTNCIVVPRVHYKATFSVQAQVRETDYNKQNSIYFRMQEKQAELNALWKQIYHDYGQYIYESTYENTDELDSVSLYNQAVTYFENYRKPKSNYSLTIINPRELEQIGTANLQINSRIRIYNKDLNLEEGTAYEQDENYDENNAVLNNISYTTNEVVVTGINYDLRKSEEASITVERIIPYQNILQKLIKQVK